MIKLFKPYVSLRARWNALRVLSGGQLAEGPQVKAFEQEFAAQFGLSNVVAVNSGSSALELAYELAGVAADDEVIVPVLTCTATNLPLVRRGAKLVFADIDYDLNISIEDVKRKITPKTKAVVFVSFGGNTRGLGELSRVCKARGIALIEDSAQAVGGDGWGQGDYTCISLQAVKTLTAGDGGFLICKKKSDCEKAKRLRWFGYDRDKKHEKGDTDLKEAGYKYHMNDISAAIGRGNLRTLHKVLRHRRKLAAIYRSYGLFAHAWLAGGITNNLYRLKDAYESEGIEVGQHHYDNRKYTVFKPYSSECPVMDELRDKYFFVPYHHGVSAAQAHRIGRIYHDLHVRG